MLNSTHPPLRRVNRHLRPRPPYTVIFHGHTTDEVVWDSLTVSNAEGVFVGWAAINYFTLYGWRPLRHGSGLHMFRHDCVSDWMGHA